MVRSMTWFLMVMALATTCTIGAKDPKEINMKDRFILRSVDRTINVQAQFVQTKVVIILENIDKYPLKTFFYAREPNEAVPFFHASAESLLLPLDQWTSDSGAEIIRIFLNRPLMPGKITEIELEFGYDKTNIRELEFGYNKTNIRKGINKTILSDCRQIVTYTGNLYFHSMFKSLKQTTTVIVPPNSIVMSYTKAHPVSQNNHTIRYGPYKNVPSLAIKNFQVNFEDYDKPEFAIKTKYYNRKFQPLKYNKIEYDGTTCEINMGNVVVTTQ